MELFVIVCVLNFKLVNVFKLFWLIILFIEFLFKFLVIFLVNLLFGKILIIGVGSGYKLEVVFVFRFKLVKFSDKMVNNKVVFKNMKIFFNVFSFFFFRGLKDNMKKLRKNIYIIYEYFLYENL